MTELEARRLAKFANEISFDGRDDLYVGTDTGYNPIIISATDAKYPHLGDLMDKYLEANG